MVTTTCDRSSCWAGVGCELAQPSWLTGVGIPLLKVLAAVDRAMSTTAHDPYWDAPEWDGHEPIRRAQERLAVAISRPDVCREVLRGSSDVAAAWTSCVQRRRELESGGVLLPSVAVAHGMDAACAPLWNDVRRAGEALARWDGLGPVPDFDPWPHPHVQPAGRNATDRHREARYSWLTFYADEFERVTMKHAWRRSASEGHTGLVDAPPTCFGET